MHYFEVAVEARGIKQHDTLTYSSTEDIAIGSVVRIEIRSKKTNGILFSKTKKPSYPTKPIESVLYEKAVTAQHLKTALWIKDYYATSLGQVISLFLPSGAHKKRRARNDLQDMAKPKKMALPALSKDQTDAIKQIQDRPKDTVIIHGITGSGKTRIYIEQAKILQKNGKSTIILVPEIGLTSQMVQAVTAQLDEVFVVHSNMTEALRHQQWDAIYHAQNPVVIGPRSVLFSPLQNLGMVIIDESHETSYKQDMSPKYHAIHTAARLCKDVGAQLLIGSATPRTEDYYLATKRQLPIITITDRVNKQHTTDISVVDLKQKDIYGNHSKLFSKLLLQKIDETIAEKQQVLLFHNRRGSSTSVLCGNCGWVGACRDCEMPLTHHADWQQLVCHVCNFRQAIVISCPECASSDLAYKGIGTKEIFSQISKLYPRAKIARFDSDTPPTESLEKRYDELHNGSVQIIVGTQMIAKGLDLPQLKTVGVVLADTALYMPDYSANERAFQLLYQVVGRVGRHQAGTVVVQSYSPNHPAISAALSQDYPRFYQQEIKERELLSYPPFAFLLQLSCEYKTRKGAMNAAEKQAAIIKSDFSSVELLGPSPAFYERSRNGYRWQIVIKSKERSPLLSIIDQLPAKWTYDIDPINLL